MPAEPRICVIVATDADGGGEQVIRRLASGWRARGVGVDLLGRFPDGSAIADRYLEVGVGPKWSRRHAWRSANSAREERRSYLGAVERLLAEQPVSAFHLHYKREQIALTRPLSRLAPVVWTEHGRLPGAVRRGPLRPGYRAASRHAAAIVCVAPAVADDVSAVVVRSAHTVVLPNGVDVERFSPPSREARAAARTALGLHSKRPVVAVLSRLHARKRIELALEAAGELDDVDLVVAGSGPAESDLRRRAEDSSAVRFVGHLEDPMPLLHAADTLLVPSGRRAREGLPMAVLEAAAAGVPTVATSDSGLASLVRAAGGRAVEPTSSELAGGVRALLADTSAPARARRWAEEHAEPAWIDGYLKVVLAGGDPGSPRL